VITNPKTAILQNNILDSYRIENSYTKIASVFFGSDVNFFHIVYKNFMGRFNIDFICRENISYKSETNYAGIFTAV